MKKLFALTSAIVLNLTFLAFAQTAAAQDVKPFSFGVLTGLQFGSVEHETAPTETEGGIEFGPTAYYDFGRFTLRTAFIYKQQDITVGDDSTFFISIFSDDYTTFSTEQFILSVGGQYDFNSKYSWFADLNYSLNTFGFECFEIGDNFYDFNCADARQDLKDNVLSLKSGASMRFVRWLRVEPYLIISLNDVGKEQLREYFAFGTNVAFAF